MAKAEIKIDVVLAKDAKIRAAMIAVVEAARKTEHGSLELMRAVAALELAEGGRHDPPTRSGPAMTMFLVTFYDVDGSAVGRECFRLLDSACGFATSATVLDGFYCSPPIASFLVEKKELIDEASEEGGGGAR